jgi:Spy/CpxP family protein refolding chaperone
VYAEQRTRLDQLNLQQQGSEALLRSDIAEALKLTPAQMDRLKELQRIVATPEDPTPPPFTGEQLAKRREAFDRRRAKFNQDAEKVLTNEQRVAWGQLLGKKLEFKTPPGPLGGNPPAAAPPPKQEVPK